MKLPVARFNKIKRHIGGRLFPAAKDLNDPRLAAILAGETPKMVGETRLRMVQSVSLPASSIITAPCRIANILGASAKDLLNTYNQVGPYRLQLPIGQHLARFGLHRHRQSANTFQYHIDLQFITPTLGEQDDVTNDVLYLGTYTGRPSEEQLWELSRFLFELNLQRGRFHGLEEGKLRFTPNHSPGAPIRADAGEGYSAIDVQHSLVELMKEDEWAISLLSVGMSLSTADPKMVQLAFWQFGIKS